MDIDGYIADLSQRRDLLMIAIQALEQLASGQGRRGRKPNWYKAMQVDIGITAKPPAKQRKNRMSEAGLIAIRSSATLRQWKKSHPDASAEQIEKERQRILTQLKAR